MSDSRNGPFNRCLACDFPLNSQPLKDPENAEITHDYNDCWEDVCPTCKGKTETAYHLTYEQFNGYWNFNEEIGEAY